MTELILKNIKRVKRMIVAVIGFTVFLIRLLNGHSPFPMSTINQKSMSITAITATSIKSTRRNHFLKKFSINLQVQSQNRKAYGMDNRFTDMD